MRKVFISVIVVFLCAQLASADYANPPGWDTNPYFTHQSWSFTGPDPGNNVPPPNPSAPDDGGAGNPNGPASFNLTAPGAEWVDDLGMVYAPDFTPLGQRQGGWRIDGPSGIRDVQREEWFAIDIPNVKNPNLTKEVWIELTFMVTNLGHAGTISDDVDLQIYADGIIDDDYKFDAHPTPDPEPIGGSLLGEIWGRAVATFSYFPQPGDETIILSGWLDDDKYVILDQIDVDTRCIPEPATLGLLGIGALALIRRRKNR